MRKLTKEDFIQMKEYLDKQCFTPSFFQESKKPSLKAMSENLKILYILMVFAKTGYSPDVV